MGLLDLIANTVEGVAEVTVNTAKLTVSPVLVIADEDAMQDAAKGICEGSKKIGKSEKDD